MTLDDAIAAFGQMVSDDLDSAEFDVCDYERLVKWLTELKLARESAFSDIGLAARAVSENHRLKAENAKLRELVRDMWHDMPKSESCGWDSKHNHCTGYDSCNGECSYWYRMNGLRIEVSDDA